ncbi:MAG: ABC-2 family transporter protein [Bdellovibrionales bacterium]|nr:ABC-2 family transporter protein [Bdellovibrionales bacterium]
MISLKWIDKWWQTMKTAWSNYMTYRYNLFLQVVGPALVFFFIKYNLWNSIYDGDLELEIGGYTLSSMIQYHIWGFILTMLAKGHHAVDLGQEIRLGRISSYLIYPFNFWEFHAASFVAFQAYQFIVALISLAFFYYTGLLGPLNIEALALGILYAQFISIFWFILQFATGLMAFWLEETWILRVILEIMTAFLSGAFFPLEIYPQFIQNILQYTPFPYLTYYPIKIFMGEELSLWAPILTISFWMALGIILNYLLWKRGLKLYTAAGM